MNRRTMMTTLAGGVVAAGYAGRAKAAPAADGKLPVASADAAKDFPGAKELPDPNTNYKVVFSVSAKVKDDELHPTLKMIGLYLNTLAHNGVPAKIAISPRCSIRAAATPCSPTRFTRRGITASTTRTSPR